jgi:hypothetical protein
MEEVQPLASTLTVTPNNTQRAERRQPCLHTVTQQRGQGGVVGPVELLHQGVLWMPGLYEHLTWRFVTSSPAANLGEKLEQPLFTAKIGAEKQRIGVHHGDQRDVREMMSFAEHLGANHQYRVSRVQAADQAGHGCPAGHGVTIDSNNREIGKLLREKGFGLLGSDAGTDKALALAIWALAGQRTASVAVMAVQARRCFMQRHTGVTIRAVAAPATIVAKQGIGKAAPV